MIRLCFASAAIFLAGLAVSAQTAPPLLSKAQAATLLARAAEETDLTSSGAAPFHLRLKAKSFYPRGKATEGTFELWWASPERWRYETSWAGATMVELVDGSRAWVEGDDTHALDTMRLLRVLDLWPRFTIFPRERIARVRREEPGGVPATCIRITKEAFAPPDAMSQPPNLFIQPSRAPFDHTVCLDEAQHLPLLFGVGSWRIEMSDYAPFGAKRFPRELVEFRDRKPLIAAEMESLGALDAAQAGLFSPLAGAVSHSWCANMIPPRPVFLGGAVIIDPGGPPIPAPVASSGAVPIPMWLGRFALVVFSVGPRGRVVDVKGFDANGRLSMKKSERQVLLKSIFQPATCRGKPVWGQYLMPFN